MRHDFEPIGPACLDVPFGDTGEAYHCHHAARAALNVRQGTEAQYGVVALATPGGIGFYMSLDAQTCRAWATDLLGMANAIDNGKGKQ